MSIKHEWVWEVLSERQRCVQCGAQREVSMTPRRYVYWDASGVLQKKPLRCKKVKP